MNQDLLGEYRGDGVIDIPDLTMDGLGDYDRVLGFPQGDVSLTFRPYQMKFGRGRQFDIDNVDDEEHALIISSNLMAEFARTKVIPEVDAIRYARLAENAGGRVAETFTSASAAVDSVLTAEEFLQDHSVALAECTLCLSSKTKTLLRFDYQSERHCSKTIFHADSRGGVFRNACARADMVVRECLVWVKNTMVMGRQDYQWKHEPCLYGWKEGGAHSWYSDRKQTTVLEFDRPTRNAEHPTMKPVSLIATLSRTPVNKGTWFWIDLVVVDQH